MTLVDIPTNDYINGLSPVLHVRQTIDSRALPHLLAFARAFRAAGHGRLDVTEASRSRPRQLALWNAYQAYLKRGKRPPFAALAAVPYTSIHDAVTHGNAVDLGSGIATFATSAHQWAAIHGPEYGVHPTGLQFSSPEPWHFDIELTAFAGETDTPISEEKKEDDMAIRGITWTGSDGKTYAAQYSDTGFYSAVQGDQTLYNAMNESGIPFYTTTESHAQKIAADCALVRPRV